MTFPRTDAGNAEFFASINSYDLRYDHSRKRWLVWRGHWWSEDTDGLIYRRAISVIRMRKEIAFSMADENKEKKFELSWATRCESRPRLEAMIKLAESTYPLFDSGEGWDSNPMLLGVANGVIDLHTGALRDGKPEDKITLHTEVAYDPVAQCPRWLQFLDEIFGGDQAVIGYVYRAVGYCLTGEIKEHCLFLCYGTGANGKSSFLEVLLFVLSAYATNLPFSAFELKGRSSIPNDVASIAGKRLVTASETNESAELNEARIKALTGGDEITARHLYHEYFQFSPTGKFWLAANHLPGVADDSPGFWRRVRLIPFLQHFEGASADMGLIMKLKAEAPGILKWAIQGCLDWQGKRLGMPPAIKEATEEYRLESDQLQNFIVERCVVAPNAHVEAGVFWDVYTAWESVNSDCEPLKRKRFTRKLIEKGFKKDRVGKDRTWTWFGIGLRENNGANQPVKFIPPGRRTDADVKSPIVVL